MPKKQKTGKPETLNRAMKTAAARVTGESIPGANVSLKRHASIRAVQIGGNTLTNQMIRQSQLQQINTTAPGYFSPFLTAQAYQIPNNRKEIYLWSQWYYDNEPKVAAAIEFYTDFPVSGFTLECSNGYVKDYFEDLVNKLNFAKWLPLISQEYHLRGDVFIMGNIECQHCHGLNINEDGEPCQHEGATWRSISVLNPDTVETTAYFHDQDPLYYMTVTDDMVRVIQEKKPKEVYDRIPPEVRKKILAREPIHIHPEAIYHLKRGAAPWQPYGTSMVRRLFQTLAYKDKLRQAQWLVAERNILPIKIVKVGSEERPANDEDLQDVQDQLTSVANDPLLTLVTHHNFDFDYVGASGKVLQLTNEFELIEQDIIDGFMLNKAIINGEGPGYQNAAVGINAMAKRLERFRGELAYWIEERIFKPIAIWNGFTVEGKRGQEEYIYPKIKWDDLQLKDDTGKLQMMVTAQQNGVISAQTLIESFGVDYDQEVERLRFEQTANFISAPEGMTGPGGIGGGYGAQAGGAGGLGGLMGGSGAEAGGAPPSTEIGGATETAGGVPEAPAMASNVGTEENYRFASNVSNEIYNSKMIPHKQKIQKRFADKQVKSIAHQGFLNNLHVCNGRGYLGPLPEEPEIFCETEMEYPVSGGNLASPLNPPAIREAAKKEEKPKPVLFSKLEQKLYNLILSANIPYAFYAQYQAGPGLQYQLDGAFPAMKLGIEADSRTFHNSPEKIASDQQRDAQLATQGWTILRFTEEEINQQPAEILKVIFMAIRKLTGQGGRNTDMIEETI